APGRRRHPRAHRFHTPAGPPRGPAPHRPAVNGFVTWRHVTNPRRVLRDEPPWRTPQGNRANEARSGRCPETRQGGVAPLDPPPKAAAFGIHSFGWVREGR